MVCCWRCTVSFSSSACVKLVSVRPANSSGRSNGIPLSSLLLYAPAMSGSPHGVRGATYVPRGGSGATRLRELQTYVDKVMPLYQAAKR